MAGFVWLTLSPWGWPGSVGALYGKFTGQLCRQTGCFAPATEQVPYHPSYNSQHTDYASYCEAHDQFAPDTIPNGWDFLVTIPGLAILVGVAICWYVIGLTLLAPLVGVGEAIMPRKLETAKPKKSELDFHMFGTFVFALLAVNFGPWVSAWLFFSP